MKKQWLYAAGLACLMAACTGTPQSSVDEELCSIDVAGAMEALGELKLSELGSDVRYVALETTDSCLIGGRPNIVLLDKQILVYSRNDCFAFDKQTGKFLSKVGRVGEDPQAYSTATPIYNDVDGLLYFMRQPSTLQKYDVQGNYHGKLTVPDKPAVPTDFCFTDSLIIGHYTNWATVGCNGSSLLFFNEAGERVDTIPSLLPLEQETEIEDVASISIYKQGNVGLLVSRFKNGESSVNVMGVPFLWKNEGKVRFKENFNDTVYTVERNGLVPHIAFAVGKWHLGYDERNNFVDSKNRLLVSCVYEGKDNVFFQCLQGYPQTYNGVYDLETKTTRMNDEKEGFTDDLTGFMAFHPKACSLQGEYGMIVEAGSVLDWLEENPEAADNEKLTALKNLTEDSNPVVVITVPK